MRRSIHWMAIRTRVIGPILCAMTLGGHITAVAGVPEAGKPAGIVLPSEAEVREILRDRVMTLAGEDAGIGIVVGVIGPQGRRVISYGRLDRNDPRALDGDTVSHYGCPPCVLGCGARAGVGVAPAPFPVVRRRRVFS